jgi:hypothetical protein
MALQDISLRKFSRKAAQDGGRAAVIDSVELLARKFLSPPVYRWLVRNGTISTISRNTLKQKSDRIIQIPNSSSSNPERFVSELDGGYVLPTTGLSFTTDWEIIEESVGPPHNSHRFVREAIVRHDRLSNTKIAPELVRSRSPPSELVKVISTAAPLSPRYYNYYHWLIQTLPRLRYIGEYEAKTGDAVTILLPPNSPPWTEETLEMLGWPDKKIEYGTHPVYQVERLVTPSYPPVHESELQWLRDRLLPQADEIEEGANPNVFISRSSAIERRIVNEDEVSDFLADNGFTTQHLEENSVARNIALFNNADIVVGAHGAGLTDIVFGDDCKVVELFGSKVKWHYKRLSKELGLHYEYIQCEPESTDLVVDIDELKKQV